MKNLEDKIKWNINNIEDNSASTVSPFITKESIRQSHEFHLSIPGYNKTPLVDLSCLAKKLNLSRIFVKDESYRFGLNSFKSLGCSFAIAKELTSRFNITSPIRFEALYNNATKESLSKITFYTATDGNHGRGVAWFARLLGANSVVLVPKGTTQTRINNIKSQNSCVYTESLNYDQCVLKAFALSKTDKNGIFLQDTCIEGMNKEIPQSIMQGYTTMAHEANAQINNLNERQPTHIFLQAGVGSFAGSIVEYFRNIYSENTPKFIIVEPNKANCIYRSSLTPNHQLISVRTDMDTIMAGLACGEVNPVAWEILQKHVCVFVSLPDWVSANGIRILSSPISNDKRIISGESGSLPLGTLYQIMTDPRLNKLRDYLKLDNTARVLLFSTEGDTDPENYMNIVWKGHYSS
ncbi:MAG: diaminopropionate ammonia-lyase [Synergistaceae bacterium]